ncbi:MAG: ABC transporter ATP-binding protein [Actinomycetota bacterium]
MSRTNDVPTPRLAAQDVVLQRGGRTVLERVSFSVPPGATHALLGPSGSGKSSLLRCLNRLEEPAAGRICLNGADIVTFAPTRLRRKVALVAQLPSVFPGGVRANLTYGLEGVPEGALASALEGVDLDATFLDRTSEALSVGQAQRVCLARALIRDPEVLVLDEPTSALDQDSARAFERSVAARGRAGLTIVLVSHDLAQAARLAATASLLVDGRVSAEGSVEQVVRAWPGGRR